MMIDIKHVLTSKPKFDSSLAYVTADDVAKLLPRRLSNALYPFQREGVAMALQRHGRFGLWDEMGLGKTIQALAIMWVYRSEWPLLIVCPAAVRYMWAMELEKWLSILPRHIYIIKSSKDVPPATARIILVGVRMLSIKNSQLVCALRTAKFKTVIVDESHVMKSSKSEAVKNLRFLLNVAVRVLLLSGTPALSRPSEIYEQLLALAGGGPNAQRFPSFFEYAKRFCGAYYMANGWFRSDGASNLKELHRRMSPYFIRRLKKDVLSQLPMKRRQRIIVDLDPCMTRRISDLKTELAKAMTVMRMPAGYFSPEEVSSASTLFHRNYQKLYQLSGEAKLDSVNQYVKALLEGSEGKILIFGWHLSVLASIETTVAAILTKSTSSRRINDGSANGIGVGRLSTLPYIKIIGETPARERSLEVMRFQNDPSVRVAVLSIGAAGVGITLTAASTVVFAELCWTPGMLEQAEDRAHRVGQRSAVNIHYLIGYGSWDDVIWRLLERKLGVISEAIDGIPSKLTTKTSYRAEPGSSTILSSANDDDSEFSDDGLDDIAVAAALEVESKLSSDAVLSTIKVVEEFREELVHLNSTIPPEISEWLASVTETHGLEKEDADIVHVLNDNSQELEASGDNEFMTSEKRKMVGSPVSGHKKPKHLRDIDTDDDDDDDDSDLVAMLWQSQCSQQFRSTIYGSTMDNSNQKKMVLFSVSRHSQRFHVYLTSSSDVPPYHMAESLDINFSANELEMCDPAILDSCLLPVVSSTNNISEKDCELKYESCENIKCANYRIEALKFVGSWCRLSSAQQDVLMKHHVICKYPELGYQHIRIEMSMQRRRAMASRLVRKKYTGHMTSLDETVPFETFTDRVALRREFEDPIAVVCGHGGYQCLVCMNAIPPSTSNGADDFLWSMRTWNGRFCNRDCYDRYLVFISSVSIRNQLFQAERGVCRECRFRTDELFRLVLATPIVERRSVLLGTLFGQNLYSVSKRQFNNIIKQPAPGLFWQADHITPVMSGGGICDLSNIRTLCTPCHLLITRNQKSRSSSIRRRNALVDKTNQAALLPSPTLYEHTTTKCEADTTCIELVSPSSPKELSPVSINIRVPRESP